MPISADNFKINLNQNLWGMLVSFSFLGASEYYQLDVLFWFSLLPSAAMVISICLTTYAYTNNYVISKILKANKNKASNENT